MQPHILCLIAATICLAVSGGFAADTKPVSLTGWGIDEKHLDTFMAEAQAVGFDTLITWNTDPANLTKLVAAGRQHNLRIFSSIAPMGAIGSQWTQRYPDRPVPWQVMSPDEDAALKFITAGKNRFLINYQFGGEPLLTNEVLTDRIICFTDPDARALFQPVIDEIASVRGLAGLAFDGFGYQNYHDCRCERCQRLLAEYRQAHPELAADAAATAFFRGALVDYINALADYARSRRGDLQTAIHIWPVFAPDPLYGNLLDVDYCGQTAAWYTLWPPDKIAAYSRTISGEAKKYHARQTGVGMIGYYDRPGQFPVKDAAQVELEIRTMLDNGCRSLQVCSAIEVIRNKDIAAVFSKYCR